MTSSQQQQPNHPKANEPNSAAQRCGGGGGQAHRHHHHLDRLLLSTIDYYQNKLPATNSLYHHDTTEQASMLAPIVASDRGHSFSDHHVRDATNSNHQPPAAPRQLPAARAAHEQLPSEEQWRRQVVEAREEWGGCATAPTDCAPRRGLAA